MNPFLRMCREGSQVQRNHAWRTLHTQTVGEHSFNAQCIVLAVAGEKASRELLIAALYHDLAEQHTGDPPAPVKWYYQDLSDAYSYANYQFETKWALRCNLTTDEQTLLKFADSLEFMCYCLEELRLGNAYAKDPFARIDTFLKQHLEHNKECAYYDSMLRLFGSTRRGSWYIPEEDNYAGQRQ